MASRGARDNVGYESAELPGLTAASIDPTLTPDRVAQILGELEEISGDEGDLARNGTHGSKGTDA